MAEKKLSKLKIKRMVEDDVNKFMASARKFLATKAGGEVPDEWELSLIMLEAYYKQFDEINYEISQLESLLVDSRYGPMPTPLLACRDKAATRLESLMKSLGLTMKSSFQMGATDVKKEESPLDSFLKSKIEKR